MRKWLSHHTFWATLLMILVQALAVQGNARSEAQTPLDTSDKLARDRFLNKDEQFANVLSSVKWQAETVSVCWENPEEAQNEDLKLIRLSIADTWEKSTNLKFSGWGPCKERDGYVHVLIADRDPEVVGGLGNEILGKAESVILNVTFQVDPYLRERCTQTRDARSKCIRGSAIHEFGHVLGFAHEQNRNDTPKWCKDFKSGRDGDWTSAVWDRDSVMNYCSSDREGTQAWPLRDHLSEIDVLAAQRMYGTPSY